MNKKDIMNRRKQMREIKFRGKPIKYPIRDVVNNELKMPFVYGGYYKDDCYGNKNGEKEYIIQFNSTGLGYNEFVRINPETIGQYTGLKDKSGKEIYEGDVIKDMQEIDSKYKGVVKFGERNDSSCNEVGFYIDWIVGFGLRRDIGFWNDKVNVIGNIYDNPELLEEDDNGK